MYPALRRTHRDVHVQLMSLAACALVSHALKRRDFFSNHGKQFASIEWRHGVRHAHDNLAEYFPTRLLVLDGANYLLDELHTGLQIRITSIPLTKCRTRQDDARIFCSASFQNILHNQELDLFQS